MTTLVAEAPVTTDSIGLVCPFPGLRPFYEPEARLFFGREREIAAILALLEEQQLVVVHGTSGCGKSSVVRAGVVPVFRMDALANSAEGRVIVIRPSDAGGPLQALARKLEEAFPRDADKDGLPDPASVHQSWSGLLTSSPDWKCDIGEAAEAAGATLCIIIDQFEEIFAASRTGYAAEVRRVIQFLIGLGEPVPEGTALGKRSLSVILTMRSDYLGHCAIWHGFAEAVNRCQYLLPTISTVGLLRAIHQPGRREGTVVEEAVADRLLPVIAREFDGLPILQHALMRAWQYARTEDGKRIIDVDALDRVGGADGALSRHAEEVFNTATQGSERGQTITNLIFRSLSDLDSDGRIIRRSVSMAQLAVETGADRSEIQDILDVFRESSASLVMPYLPDPLNEDTIVGVSHEALLRQWDRINDTSFGPDGRPAGLVYREFQDGMVWRALSLQAQQYARDRTSVLGAAATEQRLPWYREISDRPGWIARHEGQWLAERPSEATLWRQVAKLMAASERNLVRERDLVARVRRNQFVLGVLLIVVVVLGVLTTLTIGRLNDAKITAAAKDATLAIAQETQAKKDAQLALLVNQTATANAMATRYCAGNQPNSVAQRKCFVEHNQAYLNDIVNGRYANGPKPYPNVPGVGGVGHAPDGG